MPAQPATHFPKWNGKYTLSNQALVDAPEMGSLVAAVIGGWSMTETNLGWTFATLIGAKQPVAMSMFSAARSFEVQRDLFLAAAGEVLPKLYATLFKVAFDVLTRAATHRHRFAHGVWGSSTDPKLPALLLVEAKDSWNLAAAQIKYWKSAHGMNLADIAAGTPNLRHDQIMIYQLKDLQEARSEVDRAFRIADALRQLAGSDSQRRRTIYRWICAEADIRSALQKDRKRQRPPRPTQPRRRHRSPRKPPA